MNKQYRIGKVTEVLDDHFVIMFEVPGEIDNGKAFPLHTMQQPEVGDEIVVWGGDDLLNNLFCYCILQSEGTAQAQNKQSIIFKAFSNYIQNVNGAGIQVISEECDTLMKAGNCAMVDGAKGAGLRSDESLHIEGKGVKLEDILKDIWTVFNSFTSMYQAGGMPVTLVSPGKLPDIASNIEKMLGTVTVETMEDGSSTGSAEAGSSPGNATTKTFSSDTKKCLEDLNSFLDDLNSFASSLLTGLSTIVTPMGPGNSPGGISACSTLIAKIAATKAKLTMDINGTQAM